MRKIKPASTYRQGTREQSTPVSVLGLIASSRRSTSCTVWGSCRLVPCLHSAFKLQLFSTSGSKLKSAPVLKTKHAHLPQYFHAPPESQPTVTPPPPEQSNVQYLYIKSLKNEGSDCSQAATLSFIQSSVHKSGSFHIYVLNSAQIQISGDTAPFDVPNLFHEDRVHWRQH